MRAWYRNLDWTIILLWAALVAVGLTAIYSATHGPAREFLLLSVQQNFARQVQWFAISAVVLIVTLLTSARFIYKATPWVYAVCISLLAVTVVAGTVVNGAKAWLYLGPIGLQTGEIAKVGTVLMVARFLSSNKAREGKPLYLLMGLGLLVLPAGIILLQNDTGTALVFLALAPVFLFWAGVVPLAWLALLMAPAVAGYLAIVNLTAAVAFALVFTVAMLLLSRSKTLAALGALASFGTAIGAWLGLTKVLQPHQVARIVAFADPEAFRETAGFHVIQAKAAIGSGGLFGKGFTNGTQTQLAYIPENSTDFIFCVIGEEFGFVGAVVVLSLFGVLLVRLAGLGASSGFAFPRLFVAGVTGILLVHIIVNVGMTVGMVPVIGIPLPFISYGGSALLANTAMIAIALNLHARRDEFAIYTG
jgi:rod shape determining protein RodA